ncbi:beta-1,4-galactosyltransferase 4 [Trichomycterus rosablanca]|uniref:beta-1,4-galactosyltransferase 4 n=1 Tax=Trichomycterus rosablanca TaxID=2290929 RepID=UPI002F35A056
MAACPATFRLSRRTQYVLLLVLCVSVLAWVAAPTFSPTKTFREATQLQPDPGEAGEQPEPEKQVEETLIPVTKEMEQELKDVCPETSPLLRGALALQFEPWLTLDQVQQGNGAVTEGQYEPGECKARQSVAVLIPFRNREKHLLYLLHHLHPFLQRQQLHYGIYVIHQAGDGRFNRAKLLNVGYLEALKDFSWDCFIFHDVDLVPENDHNLYTCEQDPKHLVVGRNSTGYRLKYKGYFGGVTALTREQFSKVNGFPNTYWGWGGEDDDLRIRVQLQGMKIVRPPSKVARYTMVFHKRDSGNEVNKNRMHLLNKTPRTWSTDGLNSCTYEALSVERPPLYVNITVDIGAPSNGH